MPYFRFYKAFFFVLQLVAQKNRNIIDFFRTKLAYRMTYSREIGLGYNREIKRKKCQKIGNIWC